MTQIKKVWLITRNKEFLELRISQVRFNNVKNGLHLNWSGVKKFVTPTEMNRSKRTRGYILTCLICEFLLNAHVAPYQFSLFTDGSRLPRIRNIPNVTNCLPELSGPISDEVILKPIGIRVVPRRGVSRRCKSKIEIYAIRLSGS